MSSSSKSDCERAVSTECPSKLNNDSPAKGDEKEHELGPWYVSEEEEKRRELEQAVGRYNAGWPWNDAPSKLVTQAPFCPNEYNHETGFFKNPEHVQTSPLLRKVNGVGHMILELLFQNGHVDPGNLAATCQSALHMVCNFIDIWDITYQDYNLCHDPAEGSAGKVVVVTPFRNRDRRDWNFHSEIFGLQKMCISLRNFKDTFEVLHFHRVPLLTTEILALLIPNMTKLKTLGIYNCDLIHIGHTKELLKIVRTNRHSKSVHLDFYPRFHPGPDPYGPPCDRRGYGVTWDNAGIDTRLAIWKHVYEVIHQTPLQGLNLFGKGSAFKLWLEKSPVWRVEETVEAISNGLLEPDMMNYLIHLPQIKNRRWGWKNHRRSDAVNLTTHPCHYCGPVLGAFISSEEWYWHTVSPDSRMECLGCTLKHYLDDEKDHKKQLKDGLVRVWLKNMDGEINKDDLDLQVDDDYRRVRARWQAQRMDERRAEFLANYEERHGHPFVDTQAPRPHQSGKHFAPTIYEKEPFDDW